MDSKEALNKARIFANNNYAAALHTATGALSQNVATARSMAAAHGTLMSGGMTRETAQIYGRHINDLLQAQLNGLLEGCELYSVPIDDRLATDFVIEIMGLRSSLFENAVKAVKTTPGGLLAVDHFPRELENNIALSSHAIRVEIDRRRLMAKKSSVTTVYHIEGHNSRVNINSADHSVNVVNISTEQMFANLRHELTQRVPSGDEQKDILEKLTALEQAQGSPSFAKQYTEFVAVAANHMQLIAPFMPALAEILQKILK